MRRLRSAAKEPAGRIYGEIMTRIRADNGHHYDRAVCGKRFRGQGHKCWSGSPWLWPAAGGPSATAALTPGWMAARAAPDPPSVATLERAGAPGPATPGSVAPAAPAARAGPAGQCKRG